MDIILFIVILLVVTWIPKAYNWVRYKNKYPILSAELPIEILKVGDIVYIGKLKCKYIGRKNTDGLWYVFEMENSVLPLSVDAEGAINGITAVYGRYGLKWKCVK